MAKKSNKSAPKKRKRAVPTKKKTKTVIPVGKTVIVRAPRIAVGRGDSAYVATLPGEPTAEKPGRKKKGAGNTDWGGARLRNV